MKASKDSAGEKVFHQLYCCKQLYSGEVNVFDSLPPAPTTDLLNQVAAILCTPKNAIAIRVKYIDVQMQEGFSDCGVFAIAFATALANGKQPGRYVFEQGAMRTHLMHCLISGANYQHVPDQEDQTHCTEGEEHHYPSCPLPSAECLKCLDRQ